MRILGWLLCKRLNHQGRVWVVCALCGCRKWRQTYIGLQLKTLRSYILTKFVNMCTFMCPLRWQMINPHQRVIWLLPRIRPIFSVIILNMHTQFLTSPYEYSNEWVDDVITSQFSTHFIYINDKNLTFQLWECKPCLISTQNKWEIMFILK